MPLVTFACPECQKVLKSAATVPAGKKLKCPTCGATFPMPAHEAGSATAITDRPRSPIPVASPRGDDRGTPPGPAQVAKRRSRAVPIAAGVAALLVLAVLGIGAWFFLSSRGGGQEDPLAYVPPGADFVAGADLPALLDDPLLGPQVEKVIRERVDGGGFLGRCEQETGLSTRELLGHALLAGKLDAPAPGMPPGRFGPAALPVPAPRLGPVTFILKTARPFDPRRVARAATDSVRRTAHGKTYYEVNEGDVRTLYVPSDRIIVLSALPARDLDALFASDGRTPAVSADAVALVRGVEANPCWAVLPFEAQAQRDDPAAAGQPRGDAETLTDALGTAKGAALWGAPEGERMKFGVNVACADAASATRTAEAAKRAWQEQQAALAQLGILFLFRPKTGLAYGELAGSLKFTAEGTTARATADVSRKALAGAAEELQGLQQGGPLGGGLLGPGFPGPGKKRGR
jgi:hypothetical protein